jgi:hypothetical protein
MQQSPWEPDAHPADQFFAVHEAIRFNIRASWNKPRIDYSKKSTETESEK